MQTRTEIQDIINKYKFAKHVKLLPAPHYSEMFSSVMEIVGLDDAAAKRGADRAISKYANVTFSRFKVVSI